jgi:hypothetical protein
MQLAELEDKKGNMRVAMLADTSDVPVGTLLIAFEEAQKRQQPPEWTAPPAKSGRA